MIIIDYGKLGNHYHPEFQKKQHNRKNSATKRLSAQNMMIKLIIITMTYSEQNVMILVINTWNLLELANPAQMTYPYYQISVHILQSAGEVDITETGNAGVV